MLDRRQALIGIVGGLLLAAPVVYGGLIVEPTPDRSEPAFLENRSSPVEQLERPFELEYSVNSGSTRELYDPDTGNFRMEHRSEGITRIVFIDSGVSCSWKHFEEERKFRRYVDSLHPEDRASVRIRNESRTIISIGDPPPEQPYPRLWPFLSDAWIWRRTGTTTYRGQQVVRFEPVDGWTRYNGVNYLDDTAGEALWDPRSGLIHRINATARLENVDSHLHALLVNDGVRLEHRYRLNTDVSADELARPEWCFRDT